MEKSTQIPKKGLGLRVTAHGSMSFVHAFQLHGKRRRVVIGDAANMNIGSARLCVGQRRLLLGEGTDPDADKVDHRKKQDLLVEDIIERYWAEHMSTKSKNHQGQFWCYIDDSMRPQPKANTQRGKKQKTLVSQLCANAWHSNLSLTSTHLMSHDFWHSLRLMEPGMPHIGISRLYSTGRYACRLLICETLALPFARKPS
ncbi:Arm DNA-binding domain-containing protein [uncultured Cohaesibacter sp.]|uniref:Arm DNA-binding domain-containing protein n=1 Tax=uncultured Cohaesibacter sp. TaxID=1002546 RepID=UPI00292DE101|nr:Arm DNA-binding domain-containing protein [uncultured Cohaesibacter sp.]